MAPRQAANAKKEGKMRTRFWLRFAAVALLAVLLTVGCGVSVTSANIGDAWMASDEKGSQRATAFGPGDVFYCVGTLKNAPDDTAIKASWTAVAVDGADPNTFIKETSATAGSGSFQFKLSNANSWPIGRYKVDLYLNDKLDRTLEFEVR